MHKIFSFVSICVNSWLILIPKQGNKKAANKSFCGLSFDKNFRKSYVLWHRWEIKSKLLKKEKPLYKL